MLQRRSFLNAVAVSFLSTVLTAFGLEAEVFAAQLTVTWTDSSTNEDGFDIERRVGTAGTYGQLAGVGVNVTSYTDSNLLDGTTYCYRVRSYNSAGSSGYSNEGCATTAAVGLVTIVADRQSVSFTGTVGGSVPPPQSITVTVSNGGGFLHFDNSPFYGTGPCYSGSVPPTPCASGSQATLTISDDFWATAAPGTYTAPITLSSPGAPDLVIPVTLTMAASTVPSVLTVNKSGTGSGTVTGTGINCGTDCSEPFASGTSVVLTAAAASGSTFGGWSGGGCTGTGTCTVSMSAATTVTATFNTSTLMLTVSKSGTGTGTVTGTGINCGADCSQSFASGTSVVLTAAAASGSTFAGWSGGGCTGTASTCTVSMSAATTVTASFNSTSSFALNVSVAVQATATGSASGRVVSNPAGIDCGTVCSGTYSSGAVVALTPLPGANSLFAGWTGNSDCTDGSVTMNANKSCTANFALNQALLTVTTNGNGMVDSTTGGMNCSSTCTFGVSLGSTITLRATPSTGSSFTGWSGAGCQGTGNCTVTLSSNKSVTATFVGSGSSPTDRIGVYRPSTGQWLLDLNGNGMLESCTIDYCMSSFSSPNGIPVVGEWDGSGVSQLGMFVTDTAQWRLDKNANETWEGCGIDICWDYGLTTDTPIIGRWNSKDYDRIGVFRPSTGKWYLDVNGNGKLNTCDRDRCGNLRNYRTGDLPVTGSWNGNGLTQLGLFRPSTGEWFLDYNGNRTWDGCTKDRCLSFGIVGQPVSGDWDGTGTSKIGVFDPSTGEWFLDLNGNGQWDGCGIDRCVTFGQAGDFPVVGKW